MLKWALCSNKAHFRYTAHRRNYQRRCAYITLTGLQSEWFWKMSLQRGTSVFQTWYHWQKIKMRNDKLLIISEITDNYSQLEINLLSKKIEATILNRQKTSRENNTSNYKFINPDNGCLIFTGSFARSINYKVK